MADILILPLDDIATRLTRERLREALFVAVETEDGSFCVSKNRWTGEMGHMTLSQLNRILEENT